MGASRVIAQPAGSNTEKVQTRPTHFSYRFVKFDRLYWPWPRFNDCRIALLKRLFINFTRHERACMCGLVHCGNRFLRRPAHGHPVFRLAPFAIAAGKGLDLAATSPRAAFKAIATDCFCAFFAVAGVLVPILPLSSNSCIKVLILLLTVSGLDPFFSGIKFSS